MRCVTTVRSAPVTAAAGVLLLALAGCAGYSEQTAETMAATKAGNLDKALATLESKNKSSDKDLLYHMEKGELLRLKGSYDASRDSWLAADQKVRSWEDDARTDPGKLFGDLGSVLLNDTTRRYDGRDYEKVFLNVRLAQNHLALGDWGAARTEIKKMHEREAIIAEFRSKELEAAKGAAQEHGVTATSFKELNGYPIETLEDPAVRALKNSYESAYANYLAGFFYEAMGEPSLAAPGYRKAAEMRPNVALLEDGLKNLDHRVAGKATGTDTLFVIETGSAPAIQSVTLPLLLPIPRGGGINVIATPLSWPVIRPDANTGVPAAITVDDKPVPVSLLTDVNAMARRALSDEMPGIITRSAVRAITRGVAQVALDTQAQNVGGNAALVMGLASLFTKVASVVTEVADERIWRTLPGYYSVARLSLPEGTHTVTVATPAGPQTRPVTVSGRYALVALRLMEGNLYLSQTPASATPASATPAVEAVQPPPDSKAARKEKRKEKPAAKKHTASDDWRSEMSPADPMAAAARAGATLASGSKVKAQNE